MFKQNFIRICAERNVSPTVVCKKIGISKSNFSEWTDETVPRATTLQKIANYFGVSVDYLLRKDEKDKPTQESGTISIRSRDGSVIESELSDEQIELFKNMLKQIGDKKQ